MKAKRVSPKYSEAMKKAWAKKTPEERSQIARDRANARWAKQKLVGRS